MKVLQVVMVFGFSFFANAEDTSEMAKVLHNSCVAETGVAEEHIQQTKQGIFEEDMKLKCYMKCIFFQIGAISEEGVVDYDTFITVLPEEVQEHGPEMIKKCMNVEGANGCEKAFNLNKCFYDYNPEKFMVV